MHIIMCPRKYVNNKITKQEIKVHSYILPNVKPIQYNKTIFIIHTGNMRDVKGIYE